MAQQAKDPDLEPPESLFDDVAYAGSGPLRRLARNGVLLVFAVFILVGLVGVYDLNGTARAESGPVSVNVDYPKTTRAAQDIRIIARIESTDELPETIYLDIDQDYVEMIEDILFIPEAESQTALANGRMRLEYQVPDGSRGMRLVIEGRAGDQWELRTSGTLDVVVGDDRLEVPLDTWRFP